MNLTSDIIFEQLIGTLDIKKSGLSNREPYLLRPEFYIDGSIRFLSNHMYIASADNLPADPALEPNCCILSIGSPPEAYYTDHVSLLIIDNTVDICYAFNLIQSVYNLFDEWEQALQRCVLEAENLQAILNVSQHLFLNPIVISDENFHILGVIGDHGFNVRNKLGDAPEWSVNALKRDPLFQKFIDSTGLYLYQNDLLSYAVLCSTLRIQGNYVGAIMISEVHGSNSPGTWTLFQVLAKYVQLSYERYWNAETGTSFKFFCKQLLDGVQISKLSIEIALERLAWSPVHNYAIYYIELNKTEYPFAGHICKYLEYMFQCAIAFVYNRNIVMIINNSLTGANAPKINSEFSKCVMDELLKVGISNSFSEICQFPNYYLQAVAALELGLRLRPMQLIHHFHDYCLDYMLEHISGDLISTSLCPDGLIAMNTYDKEHGTEYVKTLRVYFQKKFNTTHSAKALYIHRSTFLERLERIKHFLKLDINNPDIQLYLLLCLRLLKENETHNHREN